MVSLNSTKTRRAKSIFLQRPSAAISVNSCSRSCINDASDITHDITRGAIRIME